MITVSYSACRFPPEIIQRAIWLYLRFTLGFRDVEDLLAERGIMVSYETVRRRVNHFGPMVAAGLRKLPFPAPDAETLDVAVRRDTVGAVAAGAAADAWISAALGLSCKLVYLADTTGRKIDPAFATAGQTVNFPDGCPVLLGSLASLAGLNIRLAVPIPIGRFGPNIVVSGAAPWAEDYWRRIRIRDMLRSNSLLTASCGPSKQTCD